MNFKKKPNLIKDDKGMQDAVNIVLALVLIVIVGAIGIFIADEVLTATSLNPRMLNQSDETNRTANHNLTHMQDNVLATGQTGSSFIIILVIAFIGGIAISYMFDMMKKTS